MKKKLVLNKKTLSRLSNDEQSKILGGAGAWTTSFGSCTGGLCCSAPPMTGTGPECISEALPNCPVPSTSPPA